MKDSTILAWTISSNDGVEGYAQINLSHTGGLYHHAEKMAKLVPGVVKQNLRKVEKSGLNARVSWK